MDIIESIEEFIATGIDLPATQVIVDTGTIEEFVAIETEDVPSTDVTVDSVTEAENQ